MNKFYLVNYNRLYLKDTNYLLSIFFDSTHPLKIIAWDVIIYENRLLDNSINNEIFEEIINRIDIEDIWRLASFDKKYNVAKIAYNRVMEIIDETEVLENRRLIKIMNGKMPS